MGKAKRKKERGENKMGFDLQKFRNTKNKPRTVEVSVPQLKGLFEEGEKPVFKLRNLTGHELAICGEAVKANSQVKAMVEALLSNNAKDKAKAICESLGMQEDNTPDDLVRRINMLRFGCLEPEFTNEDSVRIASMFPEIFYDLTNHIIKLTHLGADLGELNASGTTTT